MRANRAVIGLISDSASKLDRKSKSERGLMAKLSSVLVAMPALPIARRSSSGRNPTSQSAGGAEDTSNRGSATDEDSSKSIAGPEATTYSPGRASACADAARLMASPPTNTDQFGWPPSAAAQMRPAPTPAGSVSSASPKMSGASSPPRQMLSAHWVAAESAACSPKPSPAQYAVSESPADCSTPPPNS